MEPQSKKNHGKGWQICQYNALTHFPSEAIILTLSDKRTTPLRPGIYPQNLSAQYLVAWGSRKKQSKGWDYSNFAKGETFLVS